MKWLKVGVLFAVFLSVAKSAPAPAPFADDELWRLPKNVVPSSYDISLTTNVHTSARAFTGTVNINVAVKEATNIVRLHSSNLNINNLMLFYNNAQVESTFLITPADEFLTITTSNPLVVGNYILVITFSGQLGIGTTGFYRSSYRVGTTSR